MAPKKKKTSPKVTASNLIKALKKNKTVQSEPIKKKGTQSCPVEKKKAVQSSPEAKKKKATQSCPENLSPESVTKKPISKNLKSKLSKKRKQVVVDEPVAFKQEGLKLLKRGAVTMHRIIRRKMLGIKLLVSFNKKGEPYGKAASEMQSYIGVLARTKVPIWYASWKLVPNERKNKIWNCVQMAFDVPATAKRVVWQSACTKWREFKCRLSTDYVLPYSNQPELLECPPADYSFIEKSHWDIFVADRLSKEFAVIHDNQTKRRKMSEYPHNISRKGYANLEQEMIEALGDPEIEIDRSDTWLKARQDEHGNYISDKVKEIADEIEKLKKRVREGEVTVEGSDDVLTKVLGNPEHRGRVRGQGSYVKQSAYFNLPRQKKKGKSIDEKIKEGIQKFMKEESERIVQERDSFWSTEMAKLKTALCGKNIDSEGSPNIDSQQGSCSKNGRAIIKELELVGAKKKLDLIQDDVLVAEGEKQSEKETEVEEKNEKAVVVVQVEDDQVVEKETEVVEKNDVGMEAELAGSEWELAINSPKNIVAYATVDTKCDVLHGKPLAKENARVSITRVIQGSVKIPFPIQDEIMTVEQAVGTYIAWPRDLIREVKTNTATQKGSPKGGKKIGGKKWKRVKDLAPEPEYVLDIGPDFPPALKRMWIWAKDGLADGRTSTFQLSKEAFGSTDKKALYLSDMHALCSGGEMSGSVICLFINQLQEYLKRHKMSNMVAFVDPAKIGALGCGTPAERSRALSIRFKNAQPGQFFLLPYNSVNHWALTAVNPDSQIVYHMDPLKRRIASEEWTEVVDNAIKLYKDNAKKILKKKILWENLAGVPLQTGTKDCGVFIMRYMKEICLDKELKFAVKWLRRSNLVYGMTELNEIRSDWANYFMKHNAC